MGHDATPSIRGYEYQLLRAINYLLANIDREDMFYVRIEGDNDVCAYEKNEIILEQDKHSGKNFTANSEEIKNSICIFIDNWIKHSGNKKKLRLVFVTNADYGKEQKRGILVYPENAIFSYLTSSDDFDTKWNKIKEALTDIVYKYYETEYSQDEENNKSIVRAWNEEDWKEFFSHIEWCFGQKDRDELDAELKVKIEKLCNQYEVREDLREFLLSKIKDDILSGCSEKSFINQIVTIGRVKNYILQLVWIDSGFKFCLHDKWFEQTMEKGIKLLGNCYSEEKNIDLYDDSYLEQIADINESQASYLFYGKAGMGKSHFLAHSAKKYMQKGGKSVLILGQRCVGIQSVEQKILSFLELDIKLSFDDLLCQLNELGKSVNKRSVIFF